MDLSRLKEAVANESSVEASAVQLIESLAAELKNQSGDQAAVNALADQISASAGTLARAVVDNTPAAPPSADPSAAV